MAACPLFKKKTEAIVGVKLEDIKHSSEPCEVPPNYNTL